jgi:hypothetical protein
MRLACPAARRLVSAIALACGLAGCVYSKGPLFDPKDAVLPLAVGPYEAQDSDDGNWSHAHRGTLALEGRTYTWTRTEGGGSEIFSLYDIGGNFYIAAVLVKDLIAYELLEKQGNVILVYDAKCRDLLQIPVLQFSPEVIESRWTSRGPMCRFFSSEAVATELRNLARRNSAVRRYIGAGQ